MSATVAFTGITRARKMDLLQLYNKYLSQSDKEATPKEFQRVVGHLGFGIDEEEARRALLAFSTGDYLSFPDFLRFYEWFFGVHSACDSNMPENLKKELSPAQQILAIAKRNTKSIDAAIGKLAFQTNIQKMQQSKAAKVRPVAEKKILGVDIIKMMTDKSSRQFNGAKSMSTDDVQINISFEITIWNVFGLEPFEYRGIDTENMNLEFFLDVEVTGGTYSSSKFRTKTYPARFNPSINETFTINIKSSVNVSFLDATWWLQNRKLRFSVYGVHWIDTRTSYHLLGVANIPLVSVLTGKKMRISLAANLEPVTPVRGFPVLISIWCGNNTNGEPGLNKIVYTSKPMEQLILEKYFVKIREDCTNENTENAEKTRTEFCDMCRYLVRSIQLYPDREFQMFGFNEYNKASPLPMFVIPDLWNISVNEQNFNVINFIHYMSYIMSLHAPSAFAEDEPTIMQLRSLPTIEASGTHMSDMERAIYLCSILRSVRSENKPSEPLIDAYVCIGDYLFQKYVCVVVVLNNNDQTTQARCAPKTILCPHHIYSVESFMTTQDISCAGAVSRFNGQLKVHCGNWEDPIFQAGSPERDKEETQKAAGILGSGSRKTKDLWIPVTGWHRDAVPHGFTPATLFNEKNIFFFTKRTRSHDVDDDEFSIERQSVAEIVKHYAELKEKEGGTEPTTFKRVYHKLTGRNWTQHTKAMLEDVESIFPKQDDKQCDKQGDKSNHRKIFNPNPEDSSDAILELIKEIIVYAYECDERIISDTPKEPNGDSTVSKILYDCIDASERALLVYGDCHEPYNDAMDKLRSLRMNKYMFRLLRYKTDDPEKLYDELIRSGILSSSICAHKIHVAVQAFHYPFKGVSTWIAFLFRYEPDRKDHTSQQECCNSSSA